jgi:hypothetical protein
MNEQHNLIKKLFFFAVESLAFALVTSNEAMQSS